MKDSKSYTYQPVYCAVCKNRIIPGHNFWFWKSIDVWVSLCSVTCKSVYTLTGGLV